MQYRLEHSIVIQWGTSSAVNSNVMQVGEVQSFVRLSRGGHYKEDYISMHRFDHSFISTTSTLRLTKAFSFGSFCFLFCFTFYCCNIFTSGDIWEDLHVSRERTQALCTCNWAFQRALEIAMVTIEQVYGYEYKTIALLVENKTRPS